MKRLLITLAIVAFGAVACQQYGDLAKYRNIPGVEVGEVQEDGTQHVSYRDVALPDADFGRAEMLAVLSLIGDQKGDIDDSLFVERLLNNVFSPIDRFMKDTENKYGGDQWEWAKDLTGGPVFCDLLFAEDGNYYIPTSPGCASVGDPATEYMHQQGYHGWFTAEDWSYDADTDTLTTFDSGFELKAKILFFDGERVVLLGHLGGVASIGWCGSNNNIRVICDEELYLYTFSDERDSFFEGLLPVDEYNAMVDEFESSNE